MPDIIAITKIVYILIIIYNSSKQNRNKFRKYQKIRGLLKSLQFIIFVIALDIKIWIIRAILFPILQKNIIMKKLVSIILLSLVISYSYAQHRGRGEVKWLSLAIKGGYGGNVMLNKDVLTDPNIKVNFLSPHFAFGGRFGITYGDNIGINVEPLWSTSNQEYTIKATNSYIKTQKFKSFDLLVSLRYINDYGFYIEAGPQFSTLKSATVENDVAGIYTENMNGDYLNNFTPKFKSVAFGLGFAAINADRLQMFVGLRANYGLGNFIDNSSFYVLKDGVYSPTYAATAKTSPITYKLMMELNYFFGFWGNATCGKGRLMFFQ